MLSANPTHAALLATVLGPLSHLLIWMRFDFDSVSHKLLVLANLIVLCGPPALWLRGSSLSNAVATSLTFNICLTASLFTSIAVYRAFFHPLRQYPGPPFARLTVFWKVKQFKDSNYQPYKVIDKLHKQYGNVVRLGPRQLSINEPAAYQAVYGASSECHRLAIMERLRKNLQSLADPQEHKVRRNVWDHGLNAKACQTYLPRINEITNRFCTAMSKFDGKSVRVNSWAHYYTFDIMGDLGYGQSYGQLETGKGHPAIEKVENFLKAGVIAIQMMWVVNFLSLIPGLDDPMRELKEWADQLLAEREQTRAIEKREHDRDLMSYVYESREVVDSRWPMTDNDISEDAVTLQVAGSDTSYSVLVNMCHYLANYPNLQKKIREEIMTTFDDSDPDSSPTWSRLASIQNCPYLDATVNEVLRRHAPVPMGTMRETPDRTIKIEGYTIPPRTIISCPIWSLQYDERSFAEADKFVPERWLDKSHPKSQAEMLKDRRGFVPFSVGPMSCAGKYFAYMEIKVFFAKVLRQFEIVFPSEESSRDLADASAQQERDKKLVAGTKDYLTQWASDVDICFRPIVS